MYTRGGDNGDTGLLGAKRVSKDSPRVEAYGTVDELNSCIGVALAECADAELASKLKDIQRLLFVAGADMASDFSGKEDKIPRIRAEDTVRMEKEIDAIYEKLPKLVNFILPGGGRLSAQLHLARSVSRRAERRIISARRSETINPDLVPYFNRLSTYLFNLARYANMKEGRKDDLWEP